MSSFPAICKDEMIPQLRNSINTSFKKVITESENDLLNAFRWTPNHHRHSSIVNQGTINLFKNSAWLAQAMILGAFLVTTAFGQSGSLRGLVTDQHGAVVPGATVTARGPNDRSKTAITDQSGCYSIVGLPPGSYS